MGSTKIHLRVLPKIQRDLWAKLAGADLFKPFYLAGGTALALRLEHRESIDFDFFSLAPFGNEALIGKLRPLGELEVIESSPGTLHVRMLGVKTSFFSYPYPLLYPVDESAGIRIADLGDIAVMKLIAISQRGARKDFIDLHAILRAGWNLQVLFDLLPKKFPGVSYNRLHLLKSLTWFEDAESDPPPRLKAKVSWENVKRELELEARKMV